MERGGRRSVGSRDSDDRVSRVSRSIASCHLPAEGPDCGGGMPAPVPRIRRCTLMVAGGIEVVKASPAAIRDGVVPVPCPAAGGDRPGVKITDRSCANRNVSCANGIGAVL